jgi:predicted Na+-dependent transporter
LLYSSFLAVATIPVSMGWLAGSLAKVSPVDMLLTLLYTMVVPFLLHLPLRRVALIRKITGRYNALWTLLGLSTIFITATARNKPAILGNPTLVLLYASIAIALYFVLYTLGYFLLPNRTDLEKRTFSISSGANNIGLGVTITALFFPGPMNIFFIVAQLAWVLALVPLRRIFRKFSPPS